MVCRRRLARSRHGRTVRERRRHSLRRVKTQPAYSLTSAVSRFQRGKRADCHVRLRFQNALARREEDKTLRGELAQEKPPISASHFEFLDRKGCRRLSEHRVRLHSNARGQVRNLWHRSPEARLSFARLDAGFPESPPRLSLPGSHRSPAQCILRAKDTAGYVPCPPPLTEGQKMSGKSLQA